MTLTELDIHVLVFLGKGLLFATPAAAIGFILAKKSSAKTLSLYWRTVIAGLLLLPFIAVFMPWLALLEVEPPIPSGGAPAVVADGAVAAGSGGATVEAESIPLAQPLPWMFLIWLAGAAIVLARWLAARISILKLCRDAERSSVFDAGRASVLTSSSARMPMAPGLLRKVVLLPDEARFWSEGKREIVLTHELAHLERRDALFRLIAHLAVAMQWVNPLAWLVARALRMADERSADDAVLAWGAEPETYASLLVEFARNGKASGDFLAAPSMARPSTVGKRIERLLDPRQPRGRPGIRAWIGSLGIVLGCALAIGAVTAQEAEAPDKQAMPVAKKLLEIRIPSLQFEEVSVTEALKVLQEKSVKFDRSEKDADRKGIVIELQRDAADLEERRITISLSDIPLQEALHYVTQLAGMEFAVSDSKVVVGENLGESLTTRVFEVSPDILETMQQRFPARDEPESETGSPAKDLLERAGIPFSEVSAAHYERSTSKLVVRNTFDNIRKVEQLLSRVNNQTTKTKLESIVVPEVELRDASLLQAIAYLRKVSRELDSATSAPEHRGVNFLYQQTESSSEANKKATLNLTDATLRETVDAVSEAFGLSYRILTYGVVFGDFTREN